MEQKESSTLPKRTGNSRKDKIKNRDICHTHTTHSTCDGNDEASDELKEENDNSESSQANKEVEKENNIRDLNDWVDYIMEDDKGKLKYSPKKKKLNKTNQNKKKKKTKKTTENSEIKSDKILDEDERLLNEFKNKLENESLYAKEV